jgi:hypothetical protein
MVIWLLTKHSKPLEMPRRHCVNMDYVSNNKIQKVLLRQGKRQLKQKLL